MPIDPETSRPTRIAKKLVDGKRTRVGIRSGAEVGDAPKPAKSSKKEG